MNMKKLLVGLCFIIILFFAVDYFVTTPNNVDIKVEEIKDGFAGIITDKYAVRDTPPTHLKVEINGSFNKTISPNRELVKYAEVGDSLFKPVNSNYIFHINKSGISKKFFFTKLSYETRKNSNFPEEWKGKWLESSEWDKKNITNE